MTTSLTKVVFDVPPKSAFGKFAWTGPSMGVFTAIPYSPPRQNLFDHDCNPLAGGNTIHSTSQ